jgi:hypothetical protein
MEMETPEQDNPYIVDPPTSFEPADELEESAAREQVERLREAIRYHDYRYYVLSDPVIADRTYDALFDRLLELEEAFDLQHPDSPTRRVGGQPVDELETVEHAAPMLSLDASVEAEDVRAFDQRVRRYLDEDGEREGGGSETSQPLQYVCEPKFDGLSVEIVYEEGRYVRRERHQRSVSRSRSWASRRSKYEVRTRVTAWSTRPRRFSSWSSAKRPAVLTPMNARASKIGCSRLMLLCQALSEPNCTPMNSPAGADGAKIRAGREEARGETCRV